MELNASIWLADIMREGEGGSSSLSGVWMAVHAQIGAVGMEHLLIFSVKLSERIWGEQQINIISYI